MPAAARVGDLTSHGTPLTPPGPAGGSPTVLIGKLPAWRAGIDVHICPLLSGTVPHTGGVVLKGSTTVFINGAPAVRASDAVTEAAGPPNQISGGCPTVSIGG
jgi:uncharacterized Zn-binding protein involved in type VI secretion